MELSIINALSHVMRRRRFIALAGGAASIAGCTEENAPEESGNLNSEGANETVDDNNENEEERENEEEEEEEEEENEEDEESDTQPYTDYQLDVRNERWGAHPVWIDQNEYLYGRAGSRVVGSDDWYETTETLFTFGETDTVRAIIVPESGRVIVGIQDQEAGQGRIEVLDSDFTDSTTAYQFDYGTATHSIGHVTYDDIVIIGAYGMSDWDGGRHPNEVILSTDGGATFEKILEVDLHTENATNLHIHDVEYDPYAERIWVSVGDHGNSQIYWSDDLGDSWTEIDERGKATQPTQIAAFRDCVVFGTDSAPEGIIRWERDGPNDEPTGIEDLVRPHVAIEDEPSEEGMRMWAQRRWHVREDDGRELCLIPFRYSRHPDWRQSVVLGSVDGDEWYELYRIDNEDVLLSNVMGPLSMDGERRVIVSDSTRNDGYMIDATVPAFWD